jgi:molybdenum cofactor biosynthesis enzyme MoaA
MCSTICVQRDEKSKKVLQMDTAVKSMIQFINTKKEENICKEAMQVSLLWNGKRNTCLNRDDDFTYAHLGSGAPQSAHILLSLFIMRSFNFFALPTTGLVDLMC